jgi:carbamoyltransferase
MNTSFNIRGEPIVCRPTEALRCFLATGMDALVIGGFVVRKDRFTRQSTSGEATAA